MKRQWKGNITEPSSSYSFRDMTWPCRSELRWHAGQYEADPSPILRQSIDFVSCPEVRTPDVSDVMPKTEPVLGISDLFKGPSLGDKREQQRLQVAQTWGVWLWLIAELVPHGDTPHHPFQPKPPASPKPALPTWLNMRALVTPQLYSIQPPPRYLWNLNGPHYSIVWQPRHLFPWLIDHTES